MENKKQVGKISEEDFNKLPKAKQEEILKKRKERLVKLEKIGNKSLIELSEESQTERDYARKFNEIYTQVRKALVIIKARKTAKVFNGLPYRNQNAYEDAVNLLESF